MEYLLYFHNTIKGSERLDKTYNGFALSGSGDLITVVFNGKKSITPIMALRVNGAVKIFISGTAPLYFTMGRLIVPP